MPSSAGPYILAAPSVAVVVLCAGRALSALCSRNSPDGVCRRTSARLRAASGRPLTSRECTCFQTACSRSRKTCARRRAAAASVAAAADPQGLTRSIGSGSCGRRRQPRHKRVGWQITSPKPHVQGDLDRDAGPPFVAIILHSLLYAHQIRSAGRCQPITVHRRLFNPLVPSQFSPAGIFEVSQSVRSASGPAAP